MPEVATPNQAEREFETGSDEFFKAHSELTAINAKRTYDAYQDLDLQTARMNANEASRLSNIATQALQNAVETANMVSKKVVQNFDMTSSQAIKHADVAADALWNPIQQGVADHVTIDPVTQNEVASKAVDAAIAKSVDATVTPLVATLTEMLKVLSAMSAKIAG